MNKFTFHDAAIDILAKIDDGAVLTFYSRPVALLVRVKGLQQAKRIAEFLEVAREKTGTDEPCYFCSGSWNNHNRGCPAKLLEGPGGE